MNNYRFNLTGNKQSDMVLRMMMSHFEYLNVGMPEWKRGEMELVLKDKNANLLQLIVEIVGKN